MIALQAEFVAMRYWHQYLLWLMNNVAHVNKSHRCSLPQTAACSTQLVISTIIEYWLFDSTLKIALGYI